MQKVIKSILKSPAKYPFSAGFILIYLALNALCYSAAMIIGSSGSPGAGGALVPYFLGMLIGIFSICLFFVIFTIENMMRLFKDNPPVSPMLKYGLIVFWLLFAMGLDPLVKFYGPSIAAKYPVQELSYLFASPQKKMEHELSQEKTENVLKYIDQGASVETRSKQGHSALELAIHRGDEALVRDLLKRGAVLEANVKGNYSPLAMAVLRWNTKIVRLLIQAGANINSTDSMGQTPLIIAINESNYDLALTLINLGADIKIKDKRNRTALSYMFEKKFPVKNWKPDSPNTEKEQLIIELEEHLKPI
jgi:hypothetical protein